MKRFISLLSFVAIFSSLVQAQEIYDLDVIIAIEPQKSGTWLTAIRDEENNLRKLDFKIDRYNWIFLITEEKSDDCGCKIYLGEAEQTEDNRSMYIEFRDRSLCICNELRNTPYGVKISMPTIDGSSRCNRIEPLKIKTIEYTARLFNPVTVVKSR